MREPTPGVVDLDLARPIWDRFFAVAPLILVGTRDEVGTANIAPKHMGSPMGWENYYGFVCSPDHRTQQNITRHGSFTVSFTRPGQLIVTNLAASPRWDDDTKPGLEAIPTRPATTVDGVLVENCYLWLECELELVVDGLGLNSLILGKIVAASVAEDSYRRPDQDDGRMIKQAPLLAYLSPGRFAVVDETFAYPFPPGFSH